MKLYLCELNYLGEYSINTVEATETKTKGGTIYIINDPSQLEPGTTVKYLISEWDSIHVSKGHLDSFFVSKGHLDLFFSNTEYIYNNNYKYVSVISLEQVTKEMLQERFELLSIREIRDINREIMKLQNQMSNLQKELDDFRNKMKGA